MARPSFGSKVSLVAVALSLLVRCEGNPEAPPPAYPPPPPPPPEVTAESAAPSAADPSAGGSASSELMIGEDSSAYSDTDPSALTDFRAPLQPYGTWVDDPNYGTVWVPSPTVVGPDFVPYVTAGHWVYGDDYVWVSDYEWGWAPFHYGRWVYVDGRGWVWVPGRVYRGAWVVWRAGDDGYGYVGWAPAPPFWFWYGGFAMGVGFAIAPRYVYCSGRDVFAPVVAGRIAAGPQAAVIANHTRPYTPASPGVGGAAGSVGMAGHAMIGPPPSRLGLSPAQVPHATGNEAGVVHAQQFARPSSAVGLGAHPPTSAQASAPSLGGGAGRGALTPQRGGPPAPAARGAAPSVGAPRVGGPAAPHVGAAPPPAVHPVSPAPRAGGGRGGGRGGHR